MKHECPRCGQACMSSLQKLIISPSSSVSCQTCGKRISVRWRHSLALLAMKAYGLEPLQILLFGLILVVVAGLIQLLFMPLSQDQA